MKTTKKKDKKIVNQEKGSINHERSLKLEYELIHVCTDNLIIKTTLNIIYEMYVIKIECECSRM